MELKIMVICALTVSCMLAHGKEESSEMKSNTDSNLLIGWSSKDITPKGKVNLAGQMYMRITDKVKDPITATALAISSEETGDSVIFVSCDISTTNAPLIDASREMIKKMSKHFPVEKLVVNATHTHTAPDFRDGIYDYSTLSAEDSERLLFPKENMIFIAEKIAEVAVES
nr:hypothetical protein [Victivallales bacterium]